MKFTYVFFIISLPFIINFNNNIENNKKVDNLQPHDFKCFGAIGDSITAGFSLKSDTPYHSILEQRGSSFPIGGDDGETTIPNLFEKYGAQKTCSSVNSDFIGDKSKYKPNDFCNSAISGAVSTSLEKQVSHLLEELEKNNCINKWKFITVFIGSNDICEICLKDYDEWLYTYTLNLNHTINRLFQNTKNTYINLITNLNVGQLKKFANEKCNLIHNIINECPCILGRDFRQGNLELAEKFRAEINRDLYYIAGLYKSPYFRVSINPIVEELEIPDETYLSKLDCFHPNEKSHRLLALHTWKNLFLPIDNRSRTLNISIEEYIPKYFDIIY